LIVPDDALAQPRLDPPDSPRSRILPMSILPPRLRTLVVPLALAAALGACTQWSRRPIPAPGEDRFFAGRVRVTRAEGPPVLLDSVTIGRDSVVGREVAAPRARVSIPVSEVRRVEARSANLLATAAIVLSAAAAFAVWAASTTTTVVD
jgi:hypothetical protein